MKCSSVSFTIMVCAVAMIIISCTSDLLYENNIPEFKAPANKALCVIIRPTGLYGTYSPIWLDKKCVSGTEGNTITSFEVDPGEHLVLTKISLMTKVKFNFQPGKVYYLMQAAFPIPMVGVSTSLTPMPGPEAVTKIESEKGKIKFTKLNPEAGHKDLDDDDVKEELEDWSKWSRKEPEKAKIEIEYPGY